MKKLMAISMIFISIALHAQDSSVVLKGYVMDEESGDTLKFANVSLLQNDTIVKNTASNRNGFFQFTEVEPGVYNLKTSYVGYRTLIITGLVAESDISKNIYLQKGKSHYFKFIETTTKSINRPDQSPGLRIDNNRIQKAATRSF